MGNQINFLGTGRPITPNTNPSINREPSRRGVQYSGIKNVREFQQLISSKLDIKPDELGKGASEIRRAFGSNMNITA